MNRIYILTSIYTSENSAKLKGTTLSEMYPEVASTEEEISSEDVHKGHYFDRVVKVQRTHGGPTIYGISSVWEAD